ncbi:hypothetical protein BST91_07990 [Nonlabens tegetincola]|uniref:FkbM family methyltransferase n=1 Tax=Nonlabens tegetincola TaxID=323273 RepID=UPI000A2043F1|nr:FkbM family methyltransferase [Nonlabens tegetincola]ARN71585.1 hypothetical protein BST91_07990 [Nonlabens tegetincola]
MKKFIKNIVQFFGFEISKSASKRSVKIPYKIQVIQRLEKKFLNFNYSCLNPKQYEINVANSNFIISTKEEFFILNEIFFDDCYSFKLPEKTIVYDIGMNIGIASVYFSVDSKIDKVYSFEPVLDTYNLGRDNINRNAIAKEKCTTFNIGLGEKDKELTFSFNESFKGSVGLVHSSNIDSEEIGTKSVKVTIKDSYQVLLPLVEQHKSNFKLLKIDCEGGEYEIIDRLYETKLLSSFNIIVLEWHVNSPDIVINQLMDSGFVLHTSSQSDKLGLIYAYRINV